MPPGSGTASGRVELRRSGQGAGAHWAYFDTNGRLIVEYYDHGAAALYESANLLIFDGEGQRALLGEAAQGGQAAMLAAVRARFASWWEVRQAAEASGIPCRRETDFLP